eukprot:425805-Pelagomonas_calceolata.AAC.3
MASHTHTHTHTHTTTTTQAAALFSIGTELAASKSKDHNTHPVPHIQSNIRPGRNTACLQHAI